MMMIAAKIVQDYVSYLLLENGRYGFVAKSVLVEKARVLKQRKKPARLAGIKTPKETAYFYKNARALARCAKEKEQEKKEQIIAVLFRDSDGSVSAGRGAWNDKWMSIMRGFNDEQYDLGVPMLPKPKSEAWLLCALKKVPYQNCAVLENRSGSDNSPNALKKELAQLFQGERPSREDLCNMVDNGSIDPVRIDMPSFNRFKNRLLEVLDLCQDR